MYPLHVCDIYPTDTDIKTVVTHRYDVNMTVDRAFSGLFFSQEPRTCLGKNRRDSQFQDDVAFAAWLDTPVRRASHASGVAALIC